MKLLEKINESYLKISNIISDRFSNQIKLDICKQVNNNNTFTITLEVCVLNKINEDNYGISLSTSCQLFSHLNTKVTSQKGCVFIISDLTRANGEFVASTKELVLKLNDFNSEEEIGLIILKFISSCKEIIFDLLETDYGVV